MSVVVVGGECPGGRCDNEAVLYGDGRVEGPGAHGPVAADDVARISELIDATDWDAVRAVPFTGECPTAFDGQKHVYTFPADTGDLVFDSCEFDLTSVPVIQAIDRALLGG